jgi:hypothetical protein
VAVQIARLQEQKQTDLNATIQRNENWTRDGKKPTPGFNSHPVKGIDAKAFFALHRAASIDERKLMFLNVPWHATPIDGNISSLDVREKFSWSLDLFDREPGRSLLSNRLYGFKFNPKVNSGVPFDVGVDGTQELHIHIFSPLWSADDREYTLRFRN